MARGSHQTLRQQPQGTDHAGEDIVAVPGKRFKERPFAKDFVEVDTERLDVGGEWRDGFVEEGLGYRSGV